MCRLLLVLLVVVPSAVAHAQTPGRRLAFLVGVKEYDHSQLKPLDFPERDVDDFADVLTKAGFDKVVVLTTGRGARDASLKPTVENIDSHLDRLLTPKNRADGLRVTKHDTILVALAGHGIQPLGSDLAYFCPQDANPTMIAAMGTTPGKAKFPETLVAVDSLLKKLSDSGAGSKILLMDACRNDPGVRGRRDSSGVDRVPVSALPKQTAVLLSCSEGQFAFEHRDFGGGHGAFFHHVIEGFKGAAVDAEEGGVTFDSLVKHVGRNVPKSVNTVFGKDGGEQKPNRIMNLSTDTLLLARVAPDRPAPPPVVPKPEVPKPVVKSPSPPPVATGAGNGGVAKSPPKSGVLAPGLIAGEEWNGNGLKMTFCWCPDGSFRMGGGQDEKNQDVVTTVPVRLAGFWLAKCEVTQDEWKAVMEETLAVRHKRLGNLPALKGEGPRHPMYWVDHSSATVFCRRLTARERETGRLPEDWEYRLPTEAQWEYACRAGSTTLFGFGDDEDRLPEYAWFVGNTKGTQPVGARKANAWGLHDMHGNVKEWCRDWYYEKLPGGNDPEASNPNSGMVYRGGGWEDSPWNCASSTRHAGDGYNWDFGLRVAAVRVTKGQKAR